MRFKFFTPALVWATVILLLLAFPSDSLNRLSFWSFIPYFDKMVHFGLFCLLFLFIFYGFYKSSEKKYRVSDISYAVIISFLYALFTEIMQKYVFTGRSFDWFDIAANTGGILSASIIIYLWLKRKHRNKQKAN